MPSLPVQNLQADLPRCDPGALVLLSRIDVPVWIYDIDRSRMYWANPAALQFWKAGSLEELQHRDFNPTSLGTAERLANLRHAIGQGRMQIEHWTFYPNGAPHQRECRLSGVRMPDGSLALMVEARAEQVEHDHSFECRAIEAVRQTPLMISLVTPTGHWLMHNPAAEALMLRLDLSNVPNFDNFAALFADATAAVALRDKAMAEGSAKGALRLSGGAFRMHDVVVRRVADPVTGRISLMLSQQDVTRAHRLEQRLQKSLAREKAIAETQRHFLLLTSHDFRTPLSIIDGAARRIGKLVTGQATVIDRVRAIREAVRRMSEAVDNTLASASIAEGKVAFHPRSVDIAPILTKAIESQRALHPARSIEAAIPALPPLMVDAALVEQVFENLLSNALKYSPTGQPVDVVVTSDHAHVTVAVTDHGIGIPAKDLPRMFTRFFRGSNAGGIKGTGVGLHAVRYFMDLHGGKVLLRSAEGEGSTFTLVFPRRPAAA